MSSFRPAARTTDPEGREWEIYAYKLRLRDRQPPDAVFDSPDPRAVVLDGLIAFITWLPRILLKLFVDLPVGAVRALRSDEWTIEAVSWAPYPIRHRWKVGSELKGQVLASVEGQLARGESPRPRNAKQELL